MVHLEKKITKKEIISTLRSLDRTKIYRLAKKIGINVQKKHLIYEFVEDNAPSKKIEFKAYDIAYGGRKDYSSKSSKISDLANVIRKAKNEKKEGYSSYSKILIEGSKNIYWASPIYKHSDYNKSIAFENNEKNRKIMNVINKFLNFN